MCECGKCRCEDGWTREDCSCSGKDNTCFENGVRDSFIGVSVQSYVRNDFNSVRFERFILDVVGSTVSSMTLAVFPIFDFESVESKLMSRS